MEFNSEQLEVLKNCVNREERYFAARRVFDDYIYLGKDINEAARELTSNKNFRQFYSDFFPKKQTEKILLEFALRTIRVNRTLYKLKMDRRLTREEIDSPCFDFSKT